MRLLAAGLLVFGIGACASVENESATPDRVVATAAAAPAAAPANADSKKTCKQMKVMGSNFPRRQCMTAEEWAQYNKQGEEQVETFQRDIQNSGTNLPLGQ